MADVVGQAAAGRQQRQGAASQGESRQPDTQNKNEKRDDAEEEAICFKPDAQSGNRRRGFSRQPLRDVAVLMADTPSPAPSVISIRSDLSDAEEVDGGDPERCRLNEWVQLSSHHVGVFVTKCDRRWPNQWNLGYSVGVKRSVCARLAETPACRWRGCVPSAVLTAASAPALLPPTPFSPALQSHLARDPTGNSNRRFFLKKVQRLWFESECAALIPAQHVGGRWSREWLWHGGGLSPVWRIHLPEGQQRLPLP